MLQVVPWLEQNIVRFDLAPTGALCYSTGGSLRQRARVLISLPQERCATSSVGDFDARHAF